MTFAELGLNATILNVLQKENYTQPTPIQEQTIPYALEGKDVLGIAQTGTGKTAAFALPIIQKLQEKEPSKGYRHISALILTPTRELAQQIYDSIEVYAKGSHIKQDVIFGGVSQVNQTLSLKNGTDILIATPGRLLDLMNQGYIYLDYLEFFVLDEADRMLDMGFINDIRKLLRIIPTDRQTLFFSATMPDQIARLADNMLHNPVRVEVTPVSSTAERIEQYVYFVHRQEKHNLLVKLLQEKPKERTLIFSRTKHGADKITKALKTAHINASAIHGDKSQESRQSALQNFKTGRLKVLVATDIASRGIDVTELERVINYDLPDTPETYVHRIGRTGRAGSAGLALSF
jgi:ATP-dependent RNA helicase RhlE